MDALPLALFAAGLASGVHCVGMCGGIVSAFDFHKAIPIRTESERHQNPVVRRLLFNAGRITSYAAAGAAAGAIGGAAYAAGALELQSALAVAVNATLVLVGLYLAGADRLLGALEALGAPLWRRVQPLAARLMPARTPLQSYAAGLAWGWLPCGMVYAALGAAAFAGSPARGALAMAAFGAGTLPFLLAAGWLARRLAGWRALAGSLMLGFGVFGLARAAGLAESIRRGLLCFQ